MRNWYKYSLDCNARGQKTLPIDKGFDMYAKTMGGYRRDEAYRSKEEFFRKYFYGYHFGRLESYNDFLEKHLDKRWDIVSVASGRCANELYLIEQGYRITCSDIKTFEAAARTKELFPGFDFIEQDILKSPLAKKYDAVICLALIYLFNNAELKVFFSNVACSLKDGGCLYLDAASSPDNYLSYFLQHGVQKLERAASRWLKFLTTGKLPAFVTKHHGYRRTDKEILEMARSFGLNLQAQSNYEFTTEFRRSHLLEIIFRKWPAMERFFAFFGRSIPYVRMYKICKFAPEALLKR